MAFCTISPRPAKRPKMSHPISGCSCSEHAWQRESRPGMPLIIYEDEHLLAVNKPAGLNTHAPSPYAGEGIYDWLRHRESRWASLSIIHRLDKETSGLLLFGKTAQANRSLTEQFTTRS